MSKLWRCYCLDYLSSCKRVNLSLFPQLQQGELSHRLFSLVRMPGNNFCLLRRRHCSRFEIGWNAALLQFAWWVCVLQIWLQPKISDFLFDVLLTFKLAMYMDGKSILRKARGLLHQFRQYQKIPCSLASLCRRCGPGIWETGHRPSVECIGHEMDEKCSLDD